MTNFALLNQKEHAGLRIICDRAEQYGDRVKYAMTFPFEFRNIQSYYPIFFSKNADTGQFFPVALFGLEGDENLFLDDTGWQADYVPLMIRRQPFLIGFQGNGSEESQEAVVSIDMDNPRVNKEYGEPLFLEHGGTSEFLQEMTGNLELIHQGHKQNDAFAELLERYKLLEPFTLDVELNDGSLSQLLGLYTLKEESIQSLQGDDFQAFNEAGFLQPLFMVIASHSKMSDLIKRKLRSVQS